MLTKPGRTGINGLSDFEWGLITRVVHASERKLPKGWQAHYCKCLVHGNFGLPLFTTALSFPAHKTQAVLWLGMFP